MIESGRWTANAHGLLKRLALLGWVRLWAVIPSLGLLWRWPRLRVLGALALWFVVCFLLVFWRSDGNTAGAVLSYLHLKLARPCGSLRQFAWAARRVRLRAGCCCR